VRPGRPRLHRLRREHIAGALCVTGCCGVARALLCLVTYWALQVGPSQVPHSPRHVPALAHPNGAHLKDLQRAQGKGGSETKGHCCATLHCCSSGCPSLAEQPSMGPAVKREGLLCPPLQDNKGSHQCFCERQKIKENVLFSLSGARPRALRGWTPRWLRSPRGAEPRGGLPKGLCCRVRHLQRGRRGGKLQRNAHEPSDGGRDQVAAQWQGGGQGGPCRDQGIAQWQGGGREGPLGWGGGVGGASLGRNKAGSPAPHPPALSPGCPRTGSTQSPRSLPLPAAGPLRRPGCPAQGRTPPPWRPYRGDCPYRGSVQYKRRTVRRPYRGALLPLWGYEISCPCCTSMNKGGKC